MVRPAPPLLHMLGIRARLGVRVIHHAVFLPSLFAGLFGGIVVVIIVAVLYEGLKTLREILASLGSKNSSNKQEGSSGGEAQKKNGDMSLSSSVQSSSHVTNTHVTNHERTPLVPANKK